MKDKFKKFLKSFWKYLNKSMEVKYMALWFFIITIAVLLIHNISLRKQNVYVWWIPEEQSGISNYCYEKKDIGKVCLVETKVNQFEKTRVIYK